MIRKREGHAQAISTNLPNNEKAKFVQRKGGI